MKWFDLGALFTPSEKTKLAAIEDSATADQTGGEIKTAYQAQANAYTDTKNTKLAGIATGADVTDATNVNAAGAVMLSDAAIAFDTISEKTADTGVTIDSLKIKDQGIENIKNLNHNDATELTITDGAVTKTQVMHTIDTQADAATDNLDTINGGSNGDIIYWHAENNARDITIRHTVGNILCPGAVSITIPNMYTIVKMVMFENWWHVCYPAA